MTIHTYDVTDDSGRLTSCTTGGTGKKKMTEEELISYFATLQAKIDMLDGRVAGLAAFACALLESNPRKDELLSRAVKNLGPALDALASFTTLKENAASETVQFLVSPNLKLDTLNRIIEGGDGSDPG